MKLKTNGFGVSLEDLQALVAEGLSGGGDWCDLFFEYSAYTSLMLRDGIVSSGGCHEDYGCGIRVLNGEKTGYAYAESTDMRALRKAARSAASIASGGSVKACGTPHSVECPHNLYPARRDWREVESAAIISTLQRIESEIRRRESRTLKVMATFSCDMSEVLMFNSLGELTQDLRPMGSLAVTAIFSNGKKVINNNASRSYRAGAEMLGDSVVNALVEEVVRGIDEAFEARRPRGGKMSVVMGAGASGILLHEAMGHAFEADFNRKGQSVFSERMGQKICRSGISIVDDGCLPGNRGACNFDDEGVPGQKTYMVTDGVLTSFLHDRISAKFYGVAPTGNGRRESFRYNPIPRMRATYMENGSDGSVEDLIASVKKGIYVDRFSNGQVKIGEGDFTFFVKSGRLIENGRLTAPVSDINIIGNGPRALADIRAVASDLTIDEGQWTCGKEQSAPVSCGIPSVLVEHLTVGGGQ